MPIYKHTEFAVVCDKCRHTMIVNFITFYHKKDFLAHCKEIGVKPNADGEYICDHCKEKEDAPEGKYIKFSCSATNFEQLEKAKSHQVFEVTQRSKNIMD